MNFTLIGPFDNSNFGDEMLFHVITQHLIHIDVKPEEIIRKRLRDVKRSSCNDVQILCGGTQLYSFGFHDNKPSRILKNIAGFIYYYFLSKISFHRIDLALAIGVGPFENHANYYYSKFIIRKIKKIYVRDSLSLRLLQVKFNRIAGLLPDICFSKYVGLEMYRSVDRGNGVVLIPRYWAYSSLESQSMLYSEIINYLLSIGEKITIVYFSPKDQSIFKKLLPAVHCQFAWSSFSDNCEALHLISQSEMVVSARFHGLIFASQLNKCTVAIDLEEKLRQATYDIGESCLLYDNNPANIIAHLKFWRLNRDRVSRDLGVSCLHKSRVVDEKIKYELLRLCRK